MGSHPTGRRPRTPNASARARSILDDLRLLVRALRVTSRDAERRLGISGAQLFVLQCLGRDEALSLSELAGRTHTDPSSVSVVVSRLVERELVERSPSPEDARRVEVRLTARGRKLVSAAPEATQVRLAKGLAAMEPEARDSLSSGLADLVAQMGLRGAPPMFFEDEGTPAGSAAARATRGRARRAARG